MDLKSSDMLGGEAESVVRSNYSPDGSGAEKTSTSAGGARTVTPYVIQPRALLDSRLQLRVTVTVTPIYDSEEKSLSKDVPRKIQSNDIRKSVEYVDGKKKKVEYGQTLPDELVERIISRMPFPSLFKARALSRSWYFKFPPPSRGISTIRSTFQNLVTAVSGNWTSYCPMFITADNEIKGFDRTLSRWRRVVDLHYLGQDLNMPLSNMRSCAGPLVSFVSGQSLVVTNALTKSTRIVRNPFHRRYFVRLILEGSHSYKLLAGEPDREGSYTSDDSEDEDFASNVIQELLVYDSEMRRWTSRECSLPNTTIFARSFFEGSLYVNGELYGIGEVQTCLQIWSYHVEDGTWCLVLDRQDVKCGLGGVGGLVCVGDRVMLALCSYSATGLEVTYDEILDTTILYTCPNSIEIYQIDFSTLELTQVSKGPPQAIAVLGGPRSNYESPMSISSDANCMYFSRHRSSSNLVLTFDLRSHEWGSLSNTTLDRDFASCGRLNHMICSFEPGLCPFLMA